MKQVDISDLNYQWFINKIFDNSNNKKLNDILLKFLKILREKKVILHCLIK